MEKSAAFLLIIGLGLELTGVIALARKYVRLVPVFEVPRLLFAALFRAPAARQAAEVQHLWVETTLDSLQGLALIALGFIFQTTATLLAVFARS